ncbi:MAG: AAA family ATPase [Thiohalophilus sp.]|uniref:HelD family protein n=1 Tax=Thiohalophilus sp. TaxID=3028392 RepID=UPI00286FFF87|nr:UvrD-helicase domain-containing protein [Thiohalophilus sp.]MDR9437407.1 AAA family ATPase [Thiohalophilus sp.]
MMIQTEADEKAHLEEIKTKLRRALADIDARVQRYAEEIQTQKEYSWEHRAEMDHVEKIANRESIAQAMFTGEVALDKEKRLQKLLASPYFGRVDFIEQGEERPLPVYVGIHSFFDEALKRNRVFDWRAPIATLFYDYELGSGRYEAPEGEVAGEIALKRQYRIRHGEMEFMLDTSVNIVDDVLQETLGQASDERMKNIVATIQREQNAIIRNEHSSVLIIQGVAGSGKTSIALHRIAYLLYRFKESLSSEDILIISPNRVFADYISNVLPELGEEQVGETEIETLAAELLDHQYKFETFHDQNARLLKNNDPALPERIRAKASLDFLKQLDTYIGHLEANRFTPRDLRINTRPVPAWFLEESYEKHRAAPVAERVNRIAKDIESKVGIYYNHDMTPRERAELKESLKGMMQTTTLRNAYKDFFTWLGEPQLFQPAKNSRLEYSDVFPLIYLKMRLDGIRKNYRNVKHLLVDEMQDYTPVQYAVLSRLFPCKKTILGDANQSVNPFSSTSADGIREVFTNAFCARLNTSYRSTYEIVNFVQRIAPNAELEAIERHGEEPRVWSLTNRKQELAQIRQLIQEFADSSFHTLGILCKTPQQADRLYKSLQDAIDQPLHLLNLQSSQVASGVVITSAALAKGLEFDQVIVPQVGADNYVTEMDKNLLYIACTRAMHHLDLTCTGEPSPFVAHGVQE